MDRDEVERRVASFPQWHYQFDLNGVQTPIFDAGHVNRHRERERYFFEPLLRLCGGSLAGKRVLDLGCNAGYWSLKAIQAGADYVCGIDGRQMHIDQANLVFEVKGVQPERYQFVTGNIFEHEFGSEPFDIVLCLGLLYHVAQPVHLINLINRTSRNLAVIDTNISLIPGPVFQLRNEPIDDPRASAEFGFVLHPSRSAVVRLVRAAGFTVRVLAPHFGDWTASADYRYERRAFLCAKETDLSSIPNERAGPALDVAGIASMLARQARKFAVSGRRVDTWESLSSRD